MDKNKIKSFAIWARRNLIAAVSEKANRIGISENKIEEATAVQGGFKLEGKDEIFPLSKSDRDALVSQVNEKGFEQVMEEVAYTWFNRFMGLRYMEVNDYLPSGVRILSSEIEGKKEPDVLTKVSEIIDELELNSNEIYDLLDTGNTIDREKAYRIILVKQCNELGKIIPQMFEKISDYTELLLPDNLLEEGSVIRKMVEDIEESDWLEEVEIIGWMYQYYISEKKDEVFAALKKNVKITKKNIPAATQLFTPKWIVKYMVENSLGRLWLEGHPNKELQKGFKYYLEEAEQETEVEEELKKIREEHAKLKPEDIKVLDPCMGSGHILVYAFDVLYEIYKTAGYSEREIPRMILQNNLYGLDIDDRAAQLASFALIMKARHYNRRLFREIEREHFVLNLCSIQESNIISKEAIDYFCSLNSELDNVKLREDLDYLCKTFTDAKEYGSILEVEKVNFEDLKQRLKEIKQDDNLMFGDYRKVLIEKLPIIIRQAEIMSIKYEACVTNPPYMGNRGMSDKLNLYLKERYPNTKGDLSTVIMEKSIDFCKKNSIWTMINIPSWMFLNAYNEFRSKLINEMTFNTMLHLGRGIFGSDFGTTAFTIRNKKINNYNARFNRLFNQQGSVDKISKKEEWFFENKGLFINKNENYLKIPGNPIAYFASKEIIDNFKKGISIEEISDFTGSGNKTADNERFLRFWHEVKIDDVGEDNKWVVYSKGGEFRKYYGNLEYVVDWSNDAVNFYKKNKTSNLLDKKYWFKSGITYNLISIKGTAFRYLPEGCVFDMGGPTINYVQNLEYVIGFLNTKITRLYLSLLNPTINVQVKDIKNIPLIINENHREEITKLVKENIGIAKLDWDNYEQSKDFKEHGFIKIKQGNLCETYNSYEQLWNKRINTFANNEKMINQLFIEIYNLQNDLDSNITEDEITIRTPDRITDVKSFISYAVGCMFGRYSIDSEGLIYAGGNFNDKWSFESSKVRKIEKDEDGNIIYDSWIDSRFMPDKDNIIPITEDEYFEDDIVSRFIEFVRTVYGNETLEENLDFIADSIGRKSAETSRQAIRRYFIKDFYKEHLKVYQKRPIYWMFESGKNDGFKCLVYMHRYDEQTVAKVRTDYLHTLQRKYESEINRLQLVVDSDEYTAKDRTVAKKKIDRISKQLEECKEYDQVVAHLANEKISIDLDDGVKVNYAKFQDVKVINSKGKEVKMNLLSKI